MLKTSWYIVEQTVAYGARAIGPFPEMSEAVHYGQSNLAGHWFVVIDDPEGVEVDHGNQEITLELSEPKP